MSNLKLQHGVSRIRRAKLQSLIDQTIADDIELMANWSDNETKYIVNELLRFAIEQEKDFLTYKAGLAANPSRTATGAKKEQSQTKPVSEIPAKTMAGGSSIT